MEKPKESGIARRDSHVHYVVAIVIAMVDDTREHALHHDGLEEYAFRAHIPRRKDRGVQNF